MILRCRVCDKEMEDKVISINTVFGDCDLTIKLCEECDEIALNSDDLDRHVKLSERVEEAMIMLR